MSFADLRTGSNVGCCIIECSLAEAPDMVRELKLEPKIPVNIRGYELDEDGFQEQGLELNKLYSREEMISAGFERK